MTRVWATYKSFNQIFFPTGEREEKLKNMFGEKNKERETRKRGGKGKKGRKRGK